MFQMTAIVVSTLGVFPSGTTLFSDLNVEDIEGMDFIEIISYLITPDDGYNIPGFTGDQTAFTIGLITAFIGIGGVVVGAITKNVSIAVTTLIAVIFVPMVTKSMNFFQRLFTTWDTPALTYMGITIGVGIMAIIIITLLETPTHGNSGE